MLAAEFCKMFSSLFAPKQLEMYRKTGDMRITLENRGIIPAMVRAYGYTNQPMTILCKCKVRKSSGFLVEELDIPGNGCDTFIFVGIDEEGYMYVTLELNSDEWFRDNTDPEWLRIFNNCLAEAVRVLEVGEVVCESLRSDIKDLVDDNGFSSVMFQRLKPKAENEAE